MREDALLTGTLVPTNEPHAIAKIAGIKICESHNRQYGTDYRCVMPTNLYVSDTSRPDGTPRKLMDASRLVMVSASRLAQ
jgi:nucleoside-diphosphate-sugar epimerase